MKTPQSPEYWRGVQAAFEALQSGTSVHSYLRAVDADDVICGPDDFNEGAKAQCRAWPVVLDLPPAEHHRPDGGLAQGLFFSVSLMCFLALIVAFPKLSGPAAGALLTVTAISGVAAYRNRK